MKILVFSDKLSNYQGLCGAKSIGAEVIAFAVCSGDEAKNIPASVVFHVEADENKMFEDYFATLKEVISKENPDIIMSSSSKRCKCVAGKLAAALDTTVLTDLSNIELDGSSIKGTQMYYGGLALRTLKSKGKAIVTISEGAFEGVSGIAGSVTSVSMVDCSSKIVRKSIRKKEGSNVNLAVAKKVVGIGRGFSSKEDLKLGEDLAKAIGGEMGCSRPIAEGEGWMETSRYIGVTGVILKPDVYIACGISGQVQHLVGINAAKTIIAINKDKNAPIFKNCDYGIVGDLYKVLPALTNMIKG